MRVTVIGTGYVGLVTGAGLAYLGHRVSCVDSDSAKIAVLANGDVPIFEPHLRDLLALARERGLIEYTTDLTAPVRESEVIFIAVGTPSLANGSPDLSFLQSAARDIGRAMGTSRKQVAVTQSNVAAGRGHLVERLVRDGIADIGGSDAPVDFAVVSNPEFLQEGTAIANSFYPDRIVVGAEDQRAAALMKNLYALIIDQTFVPPEFLPRPSQLRRVPF